MLIKKPPYGRHVGKELSCRCAVDDTGIYVRVLACEIPSGEYLCAESPKVMGSDIIH
jgi:hypothetical protein